jgi:hypothetical protein
MLVDSGIQHAMRMHNIVICGLPGSTIFFHIFSQKKAIEHKMCVLVFSAAFVCSISHSKMN